MPVRIILHEPDVFSVRIDLIHQEAARALFVVEALVRCGDTSTCHQPAITALSLTSAFIPGNTSPSSMHACAAMIH